jgi:hypothetical protein
VRSSLREKLRERLAHVCRRRKGEPPRARQTCCKVLRPRVPTDHGGAGLHDERKPLSPTEPRSRSVTVARSGEFARVVEALERFVSRALGAGSLGASSAWLPLRVRRRTRSRLGHWKRWAERLIFALRRGRGSRASSATSPSRTPQLRPTRKAGRRRVPSCSGPSGTHRRDASGAS